MKKYAKYEYLPVWMLLGGGLVLALRALLYRVAAEEGGLMTANHPLELTILALTGAALVTAALTAWSRKGTPAFADNFPASTIGAGGNFLMAVAVLLTVCLWPPEMGGVMGEIWYALGIAAGLSFAWIGSCRMRGVQPVFVCHVLTSLFLCLHVVSYYQTWSKVGYLLDYLFPLLGGVALTLFAFYHTTFDVDLGKRRPLLGMGLAVVFLCTAALTSCRCWLLYAAGVLWAGSDLCRWHVPPAPPKPEPAPEEPPKEEEAPPEKGED